MEWLYYTCVCLWWYPVHLLAISLIPLADENKKQKTLFSSWLLVVLWDGAVFSTKLVTYGVCLTLDCCCCCFSGNQLNMYETNCSFGVPILLLLTQHQTQSSWHFFFIDSLKMLSLYSCWQSSIRKKKHTTASFRPPTTVNYSNTHNTKWFV